MKALCIFVVLVSPLAAQSLSVKIVNQQNGETGYTYQVPGHVCSTTYDNSYCLGTAFGNSANVNRNGSGTTNTAITAPQVTSFHATGVTLSLLLPDGRIAAVNCVSKFVEHFAGPAGNRRSCRIPVVDDIQADFMGKKVKLSWPTSVDGKKSDSETYKMLAVFKK